MRKSMLVLAALLVASLVTGCASNKMMMSDRSMMMPDGTMMMMNSDGTSRAMTDAEMNDHMAMMMKDSRVTAMMMDRMKNDQMMMDKCKTMMGGSMAMSGEGMMVMSADGTTRAMTDSEMKSRMNMMMKNPAMSKMMMDSMMAKCSGM